MQSRETGWSVEGKSEALAGTGNEAVPAKERRSIAILDDWTRETEQAYCHKGPGNLSICLPRNSIIRSKALLMFRPKSPPRRRLNETLVVSCHMHIGVEQLRVELESRLIPWRGCTNPLNFW